MGVRLPSPTGLAKAAAMEPSSSKCSPASALCAQVVLTNTHWETMRGEAKRAAKDMLHEVQALWLKAVLPNQGSVDDFG